MVFRVWVESQSNQMIHSLHDFLGVFLYRMVGRQPHMKKKGFGSSLVGVFFLSNGG